MPCTKTRRIGAALLLGLCATTAPAQPAAPARAAYESRLRAAERQYRADMQEARQDYERRLRRTERDLAKEGDLDGALEVSKERAAVREATGVLLDAAEGPTPRIEALRQTYRLDASRAQADRARRVVEATEDYLDRLGRRVTELTMRQRLQEALALRREMDDISYGAPAVRAHFDVATDDGPFANRDPAGREAASQRYGGNAAAETAVVRGLHWLSGRQEPNGCWEPRGRSVQATSLALLAFLGHGETFVSPAFGGAVRKATDYLLGAQQADGWFATRGLDHPMATYALAEAYALTGVRSLRRPLRAALARLTETQNRQGAWDADLLHGTRTHMGMTSWTAQALAAAALTDLDNRELRRCMRKAEKGLLANYQPGGGFGGVGPGRSEWTASGVFGLQVLGAPERKEVAYGVWYLGRHASLNWKRPWTSKPLYHWYFATHALHHAGGPAWRRWRSRLVSQIPSAQKVSKGAGPAGQDTGYWDFAAKSERFGPIYATTLCVLQLEVFYRYVPHEIGAPSRTWFQRLRGALRNP